MPRKKLVSLILALIILVGCVNQPTKMRQNKIIGRALDSMSVLFQRYMLEEQPDSVVDISTSAIKLILETDSSAYHDSIAYYYYRRASAHRRMSNYSKAWADYQNSLSIIGYDTRFTHLRFNNFYGLATLFYYYNQQDINVALDYLDSAKKYAENESDTSKIVYFQCEANIAKGKLDSAETLLLYLQNYASSSSLVPKGNNNSPLGMHFRAFLYEDRAKIGVGKSYGYSQTVIDDFNKSILINKEIDSQESNKYQIASVLFDKCEYLILWHRYQDSTLKNLRESFNLSCQINFNYIKMKSSGVLTKYYSAIGEIDSAKKYSVIYNGLKQGLYDSYTRTQEERLRAEREAAILSSKKQNELVAKNSRYFTIILITLFLLSAAFFYRVYWLARKRYHEGITEKQEKLKNNEDKLNLKEYELINMQEILDTKNESQTIQKEILEQEGKRIEGLGEYNFDYLCELIGNHFGCSFCGIVQANNKSIFSWPFGRNTNDRNALRDLILESFAILNIYKNENILNHPNGIYYRDAITKIVQPEEAKNFHLLNLRYEGRKESNETNSSVGVVCLINVTKYKFFIPETELIKQQLSHLLTYTLSKDKAKKKDSDTKLISNLRRGNYNFSDVLEIICQYFIIEFNVASVSFRVPAYSGETTQKKSHDNILFPLRHVEIDKNIQNKHNVNYEKFKKYFSEKRALFNIKDINYESLIKAAISKQVIFDDNPDKSPIDAEIVKPGVFKTKFKIVLPIVKNAYASPSYPNEDSWKLIHGVFNLRPYDEPNQNDISERLHYLSDNISDIFNSLLHKNKHDQFEKLKSEIDELKYDPKTFYDQIAKMITSVINSEVCSIFIHDGSNNKLVLKATTAVHVVHNNIHKKTNELKRLDEIFYTLDEEDSIIVRAFKEHESFQIYSIKDFPHSKTYLELDDSNKNDSVLLMPIKEKTDSNSVKGVIKCASKVNSEWDLHNEFWHFELETLRLISSIVYRFIESIEVDKIKDSFIHSVVHESLTPLAQMMNLSGNLVLRIEHEEMKMPVGFERFFKMLDNNIYLFKNIIIGLEDVIRESEHAFSLEITDVSLRDLLLSVVRLFDYTAMTEQKYIKTSISDLEKIKLKIDKNKILQVFINLLRNAITYSYPGKDIEVYYKYTSEILNGVNGNWHEIKFVNYGIGILHSDRESIFELYVRGKNAEKLKPQGRGIGLYLVRKIMRAHGGDCIVRCETGPTTISVLFKS